MAGERQDKRMSTGEKVAGVMLHGAKETMDHFGDAMLRDAPKGLRFVAKRIPGAPGLVYDTVQMATAKPEDRTRKVFGIIGGALGGLGGGALGAAAGGVNAPIGAIAGTALGEDVGTDIYDRNRQAIDQTVHGAVVAGQRVGTAAADEVHAAQRKLDDTRRWIEQRNADLRRRFGL